MSENTRRDFLKASAVAGAALATNFPFNRGGIANGPNNTSFDIEGRPVSKGDLAPLVDTIVVSSDYFHTIGQPLMQGACLLKETMGRRRGSP